MARKKDTDSSPDDDAGMFRRVMGDAKPLRQTGTAPEHRPKISARARFAHRDEKAALTESLEADIDATETGAGESLHFHRPSVGRRTMRRLARGYFSVQDEIDLHGMTVPQAKNALHDFIADCDRHGHACVRIVHGKGLGSGDRGPILKGKVNLWLRRWDKVLAFVSTRQIDGGTGAVYVLLRKS